MARAEPAPEATSPALSGRATSRATPSPAAQQPTVASHSAQASTVLAGGCFTALTSTRSGLVGPDHARAPVRDRYDRSQTLGEDAAGQGECGRETEGACIAHRVVGHLPVMDPAGGDGRRRDRAGVPLRHRPLRPAAARGPGGPGGAQGRRPLPVRQRAAGLDRGRRRRPHRRLRPRRRRPDRQHHHAPGLARADLRGHAVPGPAPQAGDRRRLGPVRADGRGPHRRTGAAAHPPPALRPVDRPGRLVDPGPDHPHRRPGQLRGRRGQPLPAALDLRPRRQAGRQDGPDRLRPLVPGDRDAADPVGRRGLAGAGRGGRDGPGAAAVGGHHRRQALVPAPGDGRDPGRAGRHRHRRVPALRRRAHGRDRRQAGDRARPGGRGRRDGPARGGPALGHPAGRHPLPDRRGRRRAAGPGRPRRGGTGPPRAGRLTMAAAVPRRATLRVAVWGFHLVLPLLGLGLLLAQPHFDVMLEHHVGHFVLVVGVAAVNVALGVRMSEVSRNRGDARLFLVSLVFLSSAGFLLLHALATPQVILYGRNAGFAIATPIGLLLAAVFAVLSSINLTPARAEAVLRRQALLRGGLAALMVAWAVVSLLGLPPLDAPLPEEASRGPLTALAVAGVALYTLAAVRYWLLYRRRPSVILIAILTAFALLAEAMVAVALARNWHASWWEWHLLMAFAFAFVYYSAHVQYAREGSWSSLFRGIYLQETIQQVRREHGAALEALVEAMQQPDGADRFDLTEGQAQVLERAAEALLAEREQISRLRALVAVGAEARVIVDERRLLERGVELTGQALRPDALRIGLVEGEQLVFPSSMRAEGWADPPEAERPDGDGDPAAASLTSLEPVEETEGQGGRLILPLTVKDRPAGVLDVRRAAS